MQTTTLKVSPSTLKIMKNTYQDYLQKPVPYSKFRAKKDGVTITGYTSGKVLFQGNNIDAEVNQWQSSSSASPNKQQKSSLNKTNSGLPTNFDQWTIIGSDEVGNGSYFGALTVCAVYVSKENQALLKELGAKDSKQLTDSQIRDLAWQLKEAVPYQLTICNPEKYNQEIGRLNAVSIKVALHNFTIKKLANKLTEDQVNHLQGTLIDQFTPEANYKKYLSKEKDSYNGKLYFAKRGESEHLAVACASIIARDAFLTSLETLGQPYQVNKLPSGAGKASDQVAAKLITQYGEDALKHTAKFHFKNTEKARKLARK